MDTLNLTSVTQLAQENPRGSYSTPDLFEIGSATDVLRGPMISQPYRDCSNPGTSGWTQPCY